MKYKEIKFKRKHPTKYVTIIPQIGNQYTGYKRILRVNESNSINFSDDVKFKCFGGKEKRFIKILINKEKKTIVFRKSDSQKDSFLLSPRGIQRVARKIGLDAGLYVGSIRPNQFIVKYSSKLQNKLKTQMFISKFLK
jgi:hypothetical protein